MAALTAGDVSRKKPPRGAGSSSQRRESCRRGRSSASSSRAPAYSEIQASLLQHAAAHRKAVVGAEEHQDHVGPARRLRCAYACQSSSDGFEMPKLMVSVAANPHARGELQGPEAVDDLDHRVARREQAQPAERVLAHDVPRAAPAVLASIRQPPGRSARKRAACPRRPADALAATSRPGHRAARRRGRASSPPRRQRSTSRRGTERPLQR